MRKVNGFVKSLLLLSSFLALTVGTSTFGEVVVNARVVYEPADEIAVVCVDPSYVVVHSADFFTIRVVVKNVTGLYGLDVKLSWDPSIIAYVNHTVHIPVEDYPNGVMHKPISMIRDIVSETGIPNTTPGTLCWIAYSAVNPAPLFDGDGIILSLTFQAIKMGNCPIRFISVDLAGKGTYIPRNTVDGYLEVAPYDHDLSVYLETPLHIIPGNSTLLNATVFNVGLNDEYSVSLDLLIDNMVVNSSVTDSFPVNSSATLFYSWTPLIEKTYNLTLKASPVPGEASLQNNRVTKNVLASMIIRVPEDSPTLRKAIDMASPRATIFVAAGVYYEQPVIRKPLKIAGESGSIIDGQGNDAVIQIDADHTTLDRVTIRNGYRIGIFVNKASHATIIRCHVDEVMDHGIFLNEANYTTIMLNSVQNCRTGLGMFDFPRSISNLIVGNTFLNNHGQGFRIHGTGHIVYHNNFINTSVYPPGIATWDDGEGEGNYWSDYMGEDLNGDGVGDTMLPHQGVDSYPLMEPWASGLVGDVNLDFKVNILDLVAMARIYGCTEEDTEWNPYADLARPWRRIDLFDLVTCAVHYGEQYTP